MNVLAMHTRHGRPHVRSRRRTMTFDGIVMEDVRKRSLYNSQFEARGKLQDSDRMYLPNTAQSWSY